jgi:methyl-accepting chemotaxis protein WspA
VCIVLIIGVIVIAVIFAKRIVQPLKIVNEVADLVADGNIIDADLRLRKLKYMISEESKNEMSAVLLAFQKMVGNLNQLIGQVHISGIDLATATSEISASAHQLEATATENAASTQEISATSKMIADEGKELTKQVSAISKDIAATVAIVQSGHEKLTMMNEAMSSIVTASQSISRNLDNINKKANDISGIIKTIDKISDNTTLLSLNAAIQAEKAGNHGKGFSVIARRINDLAEQTSKATNDIEFMVKQMQNSVSAGVMEMDKFGKEVQSNTEDVNLLGTQLSEIIETVTNLSPVFLDLNTHIEHQSDEASQIYDMIAQLDTATYQTKEAVGEFNSVTSKLNEASKLLQKEVSVFKTK